jgi:hypothetical protein
MFWITLYWVFLPQRIRLRSANLLSWTSRFDRSFRFEICAVVRLCKHTRVAPSRKFRQITISLTTIRWQGLSSLSRIEKAFDLLLCGWLNFFTKSLIWILLPGYWRWFEGSVTICNLRTSRMKRVQTFGWINEATVRHQILKVPKIWNRQLGMWVSLHGDGRKHCTIWLISTLGTLETFPKGRKCFRREKAQQNFCNSRARSASMRLSEKSIQKNYFHDQNAIPSNFFKNRNLLKIYHLPANAIGQLPQYRNGSNGKSKKFCKILKWEQTPWRKRRD